MTMTISVSGKDVILTDETITATRKWLSDNALAMRDEALEYVASGGKSGQRVNYLDSYTVLCERQARSALSGASDHTFAFIQRAYFIQSGDCVPLLPPEGGK